MQKIDQSKIHSLDNQNIRQMFNQITLVVLNFTIVTASSVVLIATMLYPIILLASVIIRNLNYNIIVTINCALTIFITYHICSNTIKSHQAELQNSDEAKSVCPFKSMFSDFITNVKRLIRFVKTLFVVMSTCYDNIQNLIDIAHSGIPEGELEEEELKEEELEEEELKEEELDGELKEEELDGELEEEELEEEELDGEELDGELKG
jgi:cell division protein FtsW (lipid II flippase)